MVAGDKSLLNYAGVYSSRIRQINKVPDHDDGNEELNVDLDVTDEFQQSDGLAIETTADKAKLKRDMEKQMEKNWDPLTDREPTIQDEREWRAIQLRGFMDPKKFYKGSKSGKLEPLPRRYQVGVMVGSSGIKVGPGMESQAVGTINSRKRNKGLSVLNETLASDQRWTKKKYREIQAEKTSGSKGWYSRERAKLKKTRK
ncbi:hypothetical protein BgAZ_100970 [Babesia gibsoni]|uniref:Fcf2 pre-rRNA processing C-terminal domain-containing protein n=1 Tax=Babesia gibsoni TaxID=33632 RepID=A0AAD8USK9_BABGI|nr:hypothetical protein BgAZ_100970 [Babesia gibsoni]